MYTFINLPLCYPGGMSAFGPNYGDTSFLQGLLRSNEPFTLLRYGDGEWSHMVDCRMGTMVGDQPWSQALRNDLRRVLLNPKEECFYCIAGAVVGRWGAWAERWLCENAINVEWFDAGTLSNAAASRQIQPFVDALNTRRLVMVGPSYLSDPPFLKLSRFVEVPSTDAYAAKDEVLKAVLQGIKPDDVLLVSAGMLAEIICYEGAGLATFIDCGSVWDIYVGRKSRGSHRRYEFEKLKEIRNAPQRQHNPRPQGESSS